MNSEQLNIGDEADYCANCGIEIKIIYEYDYCSKQCWQKFNNPKKTKKDIYKERLGGIR